MKRGEGEEKRRRRREEGEEKRGMRMKKEERNLQKKDPGKKSENTHNKSWYLNKN